MDSIDNTNNGDLHDNNTPSDDSNQHRYLLQHTQVNTHTGAVYPNNEPTQGITQGISPFGLWEGTSRSTQPSSGDRSNINMDLEVQGRLSGCITTDEGKEEKSICIKALEKENAVLHEQTETLEDQNETLLQEYFKLQQKLSSAIKENHHLKALKEGLCLKESPFLHINGQPMTKHLETLVQSETNEGTIGIQQGLNGRNRLEEASWTSKAPERSLIKSLPEKKTILEEHMDVYHGGQDGDVKLGTPLEYTEQIDGFPSNKDPLLPLEKAELQPKIKDLGTKPSN